MSAPGKRLIVVLGMHRSGTSAITRALNVLDVDLGDRLLPPVDGDNAKGYFVDLKNKVTDMFKEHFPGAEQHFEDFFKQNSLDDGKTKSTTTTDVSAGV